MNSVARAVLKILVAVTLPTALTVTVLVWRNAPLPPLRRYEEWACWASIISSFAGAGAVYFVPDRLAKWSIVAAALLAIVLVTWYLSAIQTPPQLGWYTFYYYVKIPGLFIGSYFFSTFTVSRVLLGLRASASQRWPETGLGVVAESGMSDPLWTWINNGEHNLEIARFVIEGDPAVDHLMAEATDELRILTHSQCLSFPAALAAGSSAVLRDAVEAIYQHLHADRHLSYAHEPGFWINTGEQQIRPPAVALNKRGTCIDLVLLFLSCLANAKLRPVYIQLNKPRDGHALAGVWLDTTGGGQEELTLDEVRARQKDGRLLILDSTGFVEGYPGQQTRLSFQDAQTAASKLLSDHSWKGWAVDISRAWESKRVVPLRPTVPAPNSSA